MFRNWPKVRPRQDLCTHIHFMHTYFKYLAAELREKVIKNIIIAMNDFFKQNSYF